MRWTVSKIDDITEVVTKGTTPTTYGMPFTDAGVNFIKAEALNGDSSLDRAGFAFVSESTHEKLKRSILAEGDILVTIAGAQLGRCGIVRAEHLPANTNQAVGIIRVIRERVNPRFVYFFFKNPQTFRMCQGIGGQAAQPNINLTVLKGIELPLPDLQNQDAIVGVLSAYDDLIENNRRRIALLEAAVQLIYREWFVHLRFPGHEHIKTTDGIPKGWERRRLGVVAENYDRKRVPLSVLDRDQRRGKFPYYGAAGILDHIDDYLFDGRYLLMGEDGTVITERGTPLLQLVQGKFWVNNHAHVLRGKDLSTEYLYCALKEYKIQGHVTGVAQPKITQKNMNRIPVTVAPDNLRRGFQEIVSPLFAQRFALGTQNECLHRARNLLLPRLINGEIAV